MAPELREQLQARSAAFVHQAERMFNKADRADPPELGVSLSGGGNRAAAFAIGVLSAMHERGILEKVDVISAVSGGSYALSWFLLQPYYYCRLVDSAAPPSQVLRAMFDEGGGFQRYLERHDTPLGPSGSPALGWLGWLDLVPMAALTVSFDLILFNALRVLERLTAELAGEAGVANLLNASSMLRDRYRKGIQATYQVLPDAATSRALNAQHRLGKSVREAVEQLNLTDVLPVTFPQMRDFALRYRLPSFVFNTTVRPPSPDASAPLGKRIFELGSLGFGSDSCGYVTWEDTEGLGWEPGATSKPGWLWRRGLHSEQPSPFATIRNFNVAPAISGAALSGTNIRSGATRWLLWLANLGLEYVVPSPASPRLTVRLSDGGHSENLGAYALLRRACRRVVIVDAEHDPNFSFGAYWKLKKNTQAELAVELKVTAIDERAFSAEHPILKGEGKAPAGRPIEIYYIKLSLPPTLEGEERDAITTYARGHSTFPQETTADQYFTVPQFRAYRALGREIARKLPSI
jgi:patatin-like phospholipase